jgi:hypothetical protein
VSAGVVLYLDESVLSWTWAPNSRQLTLLQLSREKQGISWLLTEARSNWSVDRGLVMRQPVSQTKKKKIKNKTPEQNRRYIAASRLDFFYLVDIYACVRICICGYSAHHPKARKGKTIPSYYHSNVVVPLFIHILKSFIFASLFVINSVSLTIFYEIFIF